MNTGLLQRQGGGGAFRLISGWFVFLLYAAVVSSAGMNIAGALSSLDRTHETRVQPNGSGMQLVLHHQPTCAEHHHGLTARVMTLFATRGSAADPDHLLQFSSAGSHCLQENVAAPHAPALAYLPALPAHGCLAGLPSRLSASAAPLDTALARSLVLRSTVLLI